MSDALPDTPAWSKRRYQLLWAGVVIGAGCLVIGATPWLSDARANSFLDVGSTIVLGSILIGPGGAMVERIGAWLSMRKGAS